jgi:flagellar hook protein FlgE
MGGTFSIALSGLAAQTAALSVVSNDLANLNTTGFKASSVAFHDLVAASLTSTDPHAGGGVAAPQARREFAQGTLQLTSGAFDAAVEGPGFFVVRSNAGETLYTRAGNFNLDATGNLVTATGEFVQGWTSVAGVLNTGGPVANITIPPNSLQKPSATTQFILDLNLNASGITGQASGTFSAPIQVVDSLGSKHTITVTFTKTGLNAWDYKATIPGEDLTSGTAGTPSSIGTGSVKFDANGQLTTPAFAASPVVLNVAGLADGAADLKLNWNLYNPDKTPTITQYSQTSGLSATSQDGIAVAQLSRVALSDGGKILAQYSDGSQQTVAQVALAGISNPDSLIAAGNNAFSIGAGTAAPTVGPAETGGRGKISGGALEGSTVDIAKEFTNLIVFQRSFQANSKVITTLDQISQDLLNLKQ